MRCGLTALTLVGLLSACAPRILEPGPETVTPHLTDTAFITADGTALPLHTWRPVSKPRAVILALHGFNDYGHFFDGPGDFLTLRGIASYAYDQRGFGGAPNLGTWAGVAAYARDAVQAVRAVKKRHPDLPLYLHGSSMGGAVAILAVNGPNAPPVNGVILAAPAIWGRTTMPWYQRLALWIGAHLAPEMTLTGRGLGIVPSDNYEMLVRLNQDPLIIKQTHIGTIYGLVNLMDAALAAARDLTTPTLILYGENDEIIPKAPIRRMLETLPANRHRVALYEDGFHMLLRDLQAATVWKDMAAWIINRNAPLPSKADQSSLKTLGMKEARH